MSGSELRRKGDAREGRGRGGTDCAVNLHTPDCDARDGEGHWHACGEGTVHLTPSVQIGGWGNGAELALGWYTDPVLVSQGRRLSSPSGVRGLLFFSSVQRRAREGETK